MPFLSLPEDVTPAAGAVPNMSSLSSELAMCEVSLYLMNSMIVSKKMILIHGA